MISVIFFTAYSTSMMMASLASIPLYADRMGYDTPRDMPWHHKLVAVVIATSFAILALLPLMI